MKNRPLVSICIPAYNGKRFIKKAINSALLQSYSNIEVIVVDDNSNDNTCEIVNDLLKKDNRVKLFKNKKNKGVAANFLESYKKANGFYIQHLNQDDWIDPDFIKKKVIAFSKNDNIAFVFSGTKNYSINNNYLFLNSTNKNFIGLNSKKIIFKNFYKKSGYIGIMIMAKRKDFLNSYLKFYENYAKKNKYYNKGILADMIPALFILNSYKFGKSYSIKGSYYNVLHHEDQAGKQYGFNLSKFKDKITYQKIIDRGYIIFFKKTCPKEIIQYKKYKCIEESYNLFTGFFLRKTKISDIKFLVNYFKYHNIYLINLFKMPWFLIKKITIKLHNINYKK